MHRLWIVLLLIPLIVLSGCQPGSRFDVASDGDIGEHVPEVFPLAPGKYRHGGADPDSEEMTYVLGRDATGYWLSDAREPTLTDQSLRFRMFAFSDLSEHALEKTYVVQIETRGGESKYSYYFAMVSDDLVTVLTPARADVQTLAENAEDLVSVHYGTDMVVNNSADTLTVIKYITQGMLRLEVMLQFVPMASSRAP